MYKFTYLLLCLSLSLPVLGETIESRIHDIDWGHNIHEEDLLLLESGHVLKFDRLKLDRKALRKKTPIVVSWDKNRYVTEIKFLRDQAESLEPESTIEPNETYQPSVIPSGSAQSYFNRSRRARPISQCYNRAHVWSYELWRKSKIKSKKIFLFFSRKYIRERNFGWWFHVAPMTLTKSGRKISERVLDAKFNGGPRNVQSWTNTFVKSGAYCKPISVYSDYADYPYERDCFVMKVPMYIYQPLDLEMQEVWGTEKNEFSNIDLKWAYKEAFNIKF